MLNKKKAAIQAFKLNLFDIYTWYFTLIFLGFILGSGHA